VLAAVEHHFGEGLRFVMKRDTGEMKRFLPVYKPIRPFTGKTAGPQKNKIGGKNEDNQKSK
jgi:hypothetical protein